MLNRNSPDFFGATFGSCLKNVYTVQYSIYNIYIYIHRMTLCGTGFVASTVSVLIKSNINLNSLGMGYSHTPIHRV